MQHFRAGFKKAPDIAGGLADALLVLDQGDADMSLAMLAEAGAGRYRDACLLDQERRELDAAERAERLGVLWRKTSGGTQSPQGSRFVERMLSVVETCRRQGKKVLDYLSACIESWRHDRLPPSLVPKAS